MRKVADKIPDTNPKPLTKEQWEERLARSRKRSEEIRARSRVARDNFKKNAGEITIEDLHPSSESEREDRRSNRAEIHKQRMAYLDQKEVGQAEVATTSNLSRAAFEARQALEEQSEITNDQEIDSENNENS